MRKFIFLGLFLLSVALSKAQSTKVNIEIAEKPQRYIDGEIPEYIDLSLKMMYPFLKAEFQEYKMRYYKGKYLSRFEYNNLLKYRVQFDSLGTWKGSLVIIQDEEFLPEAVIEGIDSSRFKGWDISDISMEQGPIHTLYLVKVGQGMDEYLLEMNAKGKILQEIIEE